MAQLMPLPLTVSCFSKIQIGFTFLLPAHPGSPGHRSVKQVCVYNVHLLPCNCARSSALGKFDGMVFIAVTLLGIAFSLNFYKSAGVWSVRTFT